jgi:biopolymer transport protein ExbB/TolQ
MKTFFMQMGAFGYPMAVIAIVIAALSIKKVIDLFIRKDLPGHRLEGGLHAIIFWGGVGAVLGILGQITGIYNALGAIIKATEIDPRICAMGFAESFSTTLFGLTMLLVSAVLWFVFFTRYRKLTSDKNA